MGGASPALQVVVVEVMFQAGQGAGEPWVLEPFPEASLCSPKGFDLVLVVPTQCHCASAGKALWD